MAGCSVAAWAEMPLLLLDDVNCPSSLPQPAVYPVPRPELRGPEPGWAQSRPQSSRTAASPAAAVEATPPAGKNPSRGGKMAADKPAGEEPAPCALDGGTRVGVQTLRAEAAGPE